MLTEEQLISEFKGLFQRLAVILEDNKKQLQEINERARRKEGKQESILAKEKVIDANGEWESPTVNNPEFNRARIYLNAGFTPNHSGGLTVDLYYQKHRIGQVLKLISSNGSTGGGSEPFDIAHLSGFHFTVRNHDPSNTTTVTGFKIVMYHELNREV